MITGGGALSAAWITALSSLVVAVIALLGWCGRMAWRVTARTSRFLDDYFGEAARPGQPERPGVMARLQALERTLADVRAETKPNGGTSLRDVVHRAADDAAKVKADVGELRRRVEQFERQRQERDRHA